MKFSYTHHMSPDSVQMMRHVFLVYVYDAAHHIDVDLPDRCASLAGDFLKRGEGFLVNQNRLDGTDTTAHSAAGSFRLPEFAAPV